MVIDHLLAIGIGGAGQERGRTVADAGILVLQQPLTACGVNLEAQDLFAFDGVQKRRQPILPAEQNIEYLQP